MTAMFGKVHKEGGYVGLGYTWAMTGGLNRAKIAGCSMLGMWHIFLRRKRHFHAVDSSSWWHTETLNRVDTPSMWVNTSAIESGLPYHFILC